MPFLKLFGCGVEVAEFFFSLSPLMRQMVSGSTCSTISAILAHTWKDIALTPSGMKPIDDTAAWKMARMEAMILVLRIFYHFPACFKA